jgi:ferric-dicitrate binding protein FerR (iron transport regulator)
MVKKYLAGKATDKEATFLEAYFQHVENRDNITDHLTEDEKMMLQDRMEESILKRISIAEQSRMRTLPVMLKIAATVLVVVSAGIYLYYSNTSVPVNTTTSADTKSDVEPGGNKALLTLADGSKISLDDAGVGEVTRQGNAVVSKTKDGQLSYQVSGIGDYSSMATNTIETPRGGEYQITLSDGTKVWLNAASRLEYPTSFTGNERNVSLTGEAYFEVAANKSMPFKVTSGAQTVEVLGTHFNINAYPDESEIRTTLLEGSVRVSDQDFKNSKLLKPGEQSVVARGEAIKVLAVRTVDAVAWKNGLFAFANDDIESVMRKISRWYDVEVDYESTVTREGFVGSVSRFEKLSDVLSTLELTGLVHFKIEGRRVIVMP